MSTNIDDTIPGTTAELIPPTVTLPLGSSGIIAVVGCFERGDGNKPYFIKDAADGLNVMGDGDSFSGSSILPLIFKPDPLSGNNGAASAICVKAGASVGASCILKDASAATIMNIQLVGGVWGNSVTITVATSLISGFKVTLLRGTNVLESWDNIADAQALYNKLIASDYVSNVSALNATKTIVNVASGTFTGGTEVTSPTVSDLTNALNALVDEDFDILVFTDVPSDSFVPSIIQYLENKFDADNPSGTVLPILTSKSGTDAQSLARSENSMFVLGAINQTWELDGITGLNEAQTAARYAGFIAGMLVNESPTNKIIGDVSNVTPIIPKSAQYPYVDSGITIFELKSRKDNLYGVVSAVTTAQDTNSAGKKIYNEILVPRGIIYTMKYMDLTEWIGNTDVTVTLPAVMGELNNRKKELLSPKKPIIQDLSIKATQNAGNIKEVDTDFGIKVQDIVKIVHNRVQLM